MKAREIMTASPIIAKPNDSLQEVAKKLRDCNIGCLPVVEDGKLVGMVTDRDICIRAVAQGLNLDIPVKQIMSKNSRSCSPDMDIEEVAGIMEGAQVRRLPVLSNNNLVGIISLGDIAARSENLSLCGRLLSQISQPIGPQCERKVA
jgi:CBS domain-containing protein